MDELNEYGLADILDDLLCYFYLTFAGEVTFFT